MIDLCNGLSESDDITSCSCNRKISDSFKVNVYLLKGTIEYRGDAERGCGAGTRSGDAERGTVIGIYYILAFI